MTSKALLQFWPECGVSDSVSSGRWCCRESPPPSTTLAIWLCLSSSSLDNTRESETPQPEACPLSVVDQTLSADSKRALSGRQSAKTWSQAPPSLVLACPAPLLAATPALCPSPIYMYISKHACMHARAQYSHMVITGSVLTKAKVSFVHLIGVARHLFAGAARAASGVLTALALPALLLAVSPESPRGLASVHSRV